MWLVSALVVLGDRLAAEDYFDRAPLLEMVRHLRNGVGHGNRFEIRDPRALLERLAHTRDAACCSQTGVTFQIIPDLHGSPMLFDFMGPGDVLDILISVGTYLLQRKMDRPFSLGDPQWMSSLGMSSRRRLTGLRGHAGWRIVGRGYVLA